MAKGKAKADTFASTHREWCMEYLKKQHTGFKFKKAHLMLCTNDLNKKFAMGVTVDQVDRHYRYHKENWKYIATSLSNSGNTFDETRCMVKLFALNLTQDRARRLLAKPIKLFNEMRELFIGSNADGS
uniref:Myb/SANT-like domain-containing protein n=1 Tax=Setaria italica TaxID=4555 RepID=K4AJY5_SETIT